MPARKPMPDLAPSAPDIEAEMPINFVPTALGVPVRKSMIRELYHFVRSLPADMPYADLAGAVQSAGWIWRLVERDTYASSPNLYLVRFDVLIGKATVDMELEHFDTISMSVPAEAPSPSLIARLNAAVTLMYMVFGRLPPQAQPMPQPERGAVPVIDETPPVTRAPAPAVADEDDIPWTQPVEKPPLNIVESRTPDGLPVLFDLYEVKGSADDIVEAALDTLEQALDKAQNQVALTALWNKNGAAIEFLKDFGSPDDKERLAQMFKDRAKQLSRRVV